MHTLCREFLHPEDRLEDASAEARKRFFEDKKRFPPAAYEAHNLTWKGEEWRQLLPSERCRIMGMPRGYVDPAGEEGQWYKTRAVRNSLVGNSYHVPSVMMFMYVLLSTLQPAAGHPHKAFYGMYEARLRQLGGNMPSMTQSSRTTQV